MKKETAQSECPPKVHGSKCQNTGKWYAGSTFKNGDTDTWIHLSEHTALLEAERREAYAGVLPRLRLWLEAYTTDLFTEEPPYTRPDSAAAAMGRHILGLLISEFEAAAQAPGAVKGEE